MRDPKKFKLLGDQAIEGKETKKLPINRWLYPHKRIWVLRSQKKKRPKRISLTFLSNTYTPLKRSIQHKKNLIPIIPKGVVSHTTKKGTPIFNLPSLGQPSLATRYPLLRPRSTCHLEWQPFYTQTRAHSDHFLSSNDDSSLSSPPP